MYTLSETKFSFLKEDLVATWGEEKGGNLYALADQLYQDLCAQSNDQNDEAIRHHMTTNMFPTMAYYKALRQTGYEEKEALDYVRKETSRAAQVAKAQQAKLTKLPCTYLLYRLCMKSVMKKQFPDAGWDVCWQRFDGKEMHFDMKRCIYKEICDSEGCPELCTVFCENDDISFNGLMPKIRFERSTTLGQGGDRCDFHFIKNR